MASPLDTPFVDGKMGGMSGGGSASPMPKKMGSKSPKGKSPKKMSGKPC